MKPAAAKSPSSASASLIRSRRISAKLVREKVVAEMVPPRETRAASVSDAMLADLVREGHLTPAVLPPGPPPEPDPVAPLEKLVDELQSDRADR